MSPIRDLNDFFWSKKIQLPATNCNLPILPSFLGLPQMLPIAAPIFIYIYVRK